MDVFDSKKVMLDFDNGDLQSGAFFQKGYGDGSKTTFYSEVCEPPRIAESDIIDAGDRDRVLSSNCVEPRETPRRAMPTR